MRVLVMSDIHGNLNALNSVLSSAEKEGFDACFLLGDLIDYGMHSNEVIEVIKTLKCPVLCNIWGNHEYSILNDDYLRFSSERGKESARFTKQQLTIDSLDYLNNVMYNGGSYEFEFDGKRILAVHGNMQDNYWKSITTDTKAEDYFCFDYVFSGHSHLPNFFEKYVHEDNYKTRNRKKIIFINPGSVGQPRNINSCAQYVLFDTVTEEVVFRKVYYNIAEEQMSYNGQVDDFYRERLELGI